MKKLFDALFGNGKPGRVTVDGRDFVGRRISIVGNKVVIDGVEQEGTLVGPVAVTVHGDVERLETVSGDVEVGGACGPVNTVSGNVRCGDVTGDIGTVSGDVTCSKVGGSVNSMSGDIRGAIFGERQNWSKKQ